MKTLSRWISQFCYNHPNLAIPGLMKYIAIGNVIVFVLDAVSLNSFSPIISFIPAYILQGELWRLITFIFVPVSSGPVWFVISVLLYFFIGNTLEKVWGSTRFTVFYAMGVVMNIIMGLIIGMASGPDSILAYFPVVSMYYVNMSMFFAYATLFPDEEFRVYFILSVPAKWLALLDAIVFVYGILTNIGTRQYLLALVPVVAIFNYLVFFWDTLLELLTRGKRMVRHQTSRQTINFHAAQRRAQVRKGYLRKCEVCGLTDAEDPAMEFRYCSKCNGYHCYCMKHINDHVHMN